MGTIRAHIFKERQVGGREEVRLKLFTSNGVPIDLGDLSGLPEGGDIGDVVTNTGPNEGEWAPPAAAPNIDLGPAKFDLNIPTTLVTSTTLLTVTSLDFDGSHVDAFDPEIFSITNSNQDLNILQAGVYRLGIYGANMSVLADPSRDLPSIGYSIDDDFPGDSEFTWVPESYRSDSTPKPGGGGSNGFVMPFSERLFEVPEEGSTFQFFMFKSGGDLIVGAPCIVYLNFSRVREET